MSSIKVLVFDSGNTFVKWGLHNGNWVLKEKTCHSQFLEMDDIFYNLPVPDIIVISHVSSEAIRNKLRMLISIWSVKSYWILAQSFQCGVTNDYSEPSQLGCDRWAALIAARQLQKDSCIVVNVGTAMTVDALSASGHFLGGIIIPGFYAMLNGLRAETQLTCSFPADYHSFPRNTNDAIHSGIIQGLLGAIERMHRLISQHNSSIGNCIISGGGAYQLISYLKIPFTHIENLVMDGLVIIAQDLAQNEEHFIEYSN